MKQILMLLGTLSMLAIVTLFSAAAYAHHGPVHAQNAAAVSVSTKKPLIIYFSHTGNTKIVAEMIRERVGGDFFEIVPQNAYPKEYRATTEQARKELDNGFRPALKIGRAPGLETYNVVFLGYPTWWGTLPPAVMTFLEANDMSGKTIIPFTTHGGSGMSGVSDIRKLAPRATLLEGLAVRGNSAGNAKNEVNKWLRDLGMLTGEASI